MATNRRTSTSTANQGGSLAPLVAPVALALAGVAIWFGQPGLVLVWVALLSIAFLHPAPELTGKKDSHGRPTPGNLAESRRLADHHAMTGLRWRLLAPGGHWLPGWPPLGYWLVCVVLTALATVVPVSALPALLDHEDPAVVDAAVQVAEHGHLLNAAAAWLCTTAVFATVRQRAGDGCPGTRLDTLVALVADHPLRTLALTVLTPAIGAGAVHGLDRFVPQTQPVLDHVPVWVWVVLALALALGVHTPWMRDASLDAWRKLVAARHDWDARWPAVKMHDPMAILVERRRVGENTVDVFDAPPSVGSSGYLPLAPKLAPVLGAGRTVVVLNHPQPGPDGAPAPGTVDPVRFRVVDIDERAPVDLADPSVPDDVARTLVEAGMAQATDALGVPRATLLELTPVHAEDSSRAAYQATFTGLAWASLRPRVAMLPPFFGCEVLVDHRGTRLFVGALLEDPATMVDEKLPTLLHELSVQDRWNVVWGAASLSRHRVSQPTVSPAQCATADLADGTTVERTVLITRVGVPPADYFGTEDKVAASLNGAPFVAITGYRGAGVRAGERHAQAMCVYHCARAVPSTLASLAPVEGSLVDQADEGSDATGPGRPGSPRRRPGRSRPAPSTELATHWVVAGMMNKAFESSRLKRPEVVEARCLTAPSPRGPHLWRVQLRLHDGVTLADVRSAAEKLRQSLGVPWLRVSQAADGVTLHAGAVPEKANLINPVTDRATLVSLDWERAFDDAKLVSGAGEVPQVLEVGTLPRNENVQTIDFSLPSGLSVDRVKGALKKLKASTGNEFVEPRGSRHGASAFRLLVAAEHPLPGYIPYDFEAAAADPATMLFSSSVEGEPMGLNFADNAHALLAGTQGSGKSAMAQSVLWPCAVHGVRLVIVDVQKKAADFEFLRPYASAFATELAEAAAVMQAVYAEGARRIRLNAQYKVGHSMELPEAVRPPRLVLFIDEFTSLLDKESTAASTNGMDAAAIAELEDARAINALKAVVGRFAGKIAREHRSAGISLLLATQKMMAKTMDSVPGGGDLKDNLARSLLGTASTGAQMSALRNYEDIPDLGEEVPRGRGIWEPLTSSRPLAMQVWYAEQGTGTGQSAPGTLAYELAQRIDPLPETEHLDYSQWMPKEEPDDHAFGPPPDFGDNEGQGDVLVLDLDLDLELDLADLEVGTEDPATTDDPEVHDEHEQHAEAGGEGPPDATTGEEGQEESPEASDEPDCDGWEVDDEGVPVPSGAGEDAAEGEGGPGLVAPTDGGPGENPVAGGADAPGGGEHGSGDTTGPGDDLDSGPAAPSRGGDQPDVGGPDPDAQLVHRVSTIWDDDDVFETPNAVPVAPDRSRLTADDLFG